MYSVNEAKGKGTAVANPRMAFSDSIASIAMAGKVHDTWC